MLHKWIKLFSVVLLMNSQVVIAQQAKKTKSSRTATTKAKASPTKVATSVPTPVATPEVKATPSPIPSPAVEPTPLPTEIPTPTPVPEATPSIEPTPTPAAEQAKAADEPWTPKQGLLGDIRIGPMLGSSIPAPLEYGLEGRYQKSFGGLLSMGSFTYSPADTDKIKDLKLKLSHYALQGNWFPWESSFFLGLSIGKRTIDVSATNNTKLKTAGTETPVNIDARFIVESYFIGWHLGWMKEWSSGFALGTGLGLFTPFKSSTTFEADYKDNAIVNDAIKETDAYKGLEEDVRDAGKKMGLLAMPQIQIIRMAYFF